ncbi:ferredoxin--nitrite reductase [Methylosinus sp. R-45379]|uniref:NirA family protein n=1 Tax=Methylosinus sp. R-45379 TaxID=980563 RepID=UPI0007C99432|nr:NirA family protein [Methylosinus sp. R-45379]OAI23634.1 ferredoxin--nitrite reductase [Methylosinus sp. R-45379]
MAGDFTAEQKRYLEGFASGFQASRAQRALPTKEKPTGPDASHFAAQDRAVASGDALNEQEKIKREEHPFDAYARLVAQAKRNEPPKPADNFRWRYYGLFYVAPTQSSYMCRLRIPNGVLTHWQFAGLADLADSHGGGYLHVTTRANLQIREIEPKSAVAMIEGVQSLGLWTRGSGADNIRNITGTPTAGIDPQELIDTRPFARALHFHILNDRSLFGLPRKFNIAFDGGGRIAVLEETNDVAFQAVEIRDEHGIAPGVYFRLALGGITGHKDLARDTGVIVAPDEAIEIADAILCVFIETGDRTNRARARLKYVLDQLGFDRFLTLVEDKLGRPLLRAPQDAIAPRPGFDRLAHIGVHAQSDAQKSWIGVALKLGRLSSDETRGLATIARELGDGDIRLTVWQNLLISGIADARIDEALARIEALGLSTKASPLRAGLVACTGNAGCRFAASDTKRHADEIATHCEERIEIDTPINIHLTGCRHSCAQHYIGDIGLVGARVPINEEGDTVEGYNMVVGGGFGAEGAIGRELLENVAAADAPRKIESLLRAYLAHRAKGEESFAAFTRRHDIEALRRLIAEAEQ